MRLGSQLYHSVYPWIQMPQGEIGNDLANKNPPIQQVIVKWL